MNEPITTLRMYFDGGAELRIPYEASVGVSQSLTEIAESATMRRNVNGGLIRRQRPSFRKFATEISGRFFGSPAFGDMHRGDLLTIHCTTPIRQSVSPSGTATLIRDCVSGSVACFNSAGDVVSHSRSGRSISGATGANHLLFRPILICAVDEFSWNLDDMTLDVSWSLSAVEA